MSLFSIALTNVTENFANAEGQISFHCVGKVVWVVGYFALAAQTDVHINVQVYMLAKRLYGCDKKHWPGFQFPSMMACVPFYFNIPFELNGSNRFRWIVYKIRHITHNRCVRCDLQRLKHCFLESEEEKVKSLVRNNVD